jgi:hypothetical protein
VAQLRTLAFPWEWLLLVCHACHEPFAVIIGLSFFAVWVFVAHSAPKSSSLKRLAELEAAAAAADDIPTSGGASSSHHAGSRQRLSTVEESASASDPPLQRPLTESLKRDWAAG